MDRPDRQREDTEQYDAPAGGWGSLAGIAAILAEERPSPGVISTRCAARTSRGGHMCTSCAWTKPAKPHLFEFCENGAKATIWDLTRDRCGPAFFARPPLTELRGWSDHDLEKTGPPHPSRALRPRDRPLRRDHLGGGLRGDRRGAARARPEVHGLLHLGPGEPRDGLPLCALRAALRAQQPARQLEHVPRDDERRAEEGHRLVGRHLRPVGLRALRPAPVLRPEHRLELPALPPPAAGGGASAAAGSSPSTRSARRGLVEFVNPQSPGADDGRPRRRRSPTSTCRSGPAATSRR